MRLRSRTNRRESTASECRLCLGSGRIPFIDNHFDLWMVPCPACSDS